MLSEALLGCRGRRGLSFALTSSRHGNYDSGEVTLYRIPAGTLVGTIFGDLFTPDKSRSRNMPTKPEGLTSDDVDRIAVKLWGSEIFNEKGEYYPCSSE